MSLRALPRWFSGSVALTALIIAGSAVRQPRAAWGQDPPPAPAPVADNAGSQDTAPGGADQTDSQVGQILTRGAVHEAFAAPVVHDPAPAPIVPKQPPAPIQEMPPDQKPAG